MRTTSMFIVILALALMTGSCAATTGTDDADTGSDGDIATNSAVPLVNGLLLGNGAFTGSGSFSVIDARQAYNASQAATAVAARVSVPGIDDLCLFWYMEGTESDHGLIIGDTVTREFSDWGSAAKAGSEADQTVNALKKSPEGEAAREAVGC